MSNTFLPFNFAPKAHQILETGGTTSYAIPANEFAMATYSFNETDSQCSILLNGSAVANSSFYTRFSAAGGVGNPAFTTVPTQGITYWNVDNTTDGTMGFNGGSLAQGIAANGAIVGAPAFASKNLTVRYTNYIQGTSNAPSQIWLKAGDTLSISGGSVRVLIHRYDLPS